MVNFDSALLKVEDGIMKVTDTEGDNYLEGKFGFSDY